MEKRVFLAVALSFLVLVTWNIINPPPKHVATDQPFNQDVSVGAASTSSTVSTVSQATESPTKDFFVQASPEEVDVLTSPSLNIEISNLGGAINNITINQYNETLSAHRILDIIGYENKPFTLSKMSNQEYVYQYNDKFLQIKRNYNITNDFLINSNTVIKNTSNIPQAVTLKFKGYHLDFTKETIAVNTHDHSLYEYAYYVNDKIDRKANAFKFSPKEKKDHTGKVNWVAFRNRYFCTIIKPQFTTNVMTIDPESEKKLNLEFSTTNVVLNPGETLELPAVIFAGPEDLKTLKKYNFEFEKIKKFYRFELFDAIAKIIYEILHWIHHIVPNWGACIILISTIIYFSVYPLTLASMRSMKKIQLLQPKIAALKEKYKDNPQKMNKEMMEIYKAERINPLGGCLPIFLQMPVFIGLYQVLWRDVSFKGADFLWIKDLAMPDRLFVFPQPLPLIGESINLLPILMMIIMFFQTRLQSKNMVITDEAQRMQQKMMTIFMPVFMCFIFYHFASGLTLYFTMFYLYSTLTQWKMSLKPQVV